MVIGDCCKTLEKLQFLLQDAVNLDDNNNQDNGVITESTGCQKVQQNQDSRISSFDLKNKGSSKQRSQISYPLPSPTRTYMKEIKMSNLRKQNEGPDTSSYNKVCVQQDLCLHQL